MLIRAGADKAAVNKDGHQAITGLGPQMNGIALVVAALELLGSSSTD